MIKRPYPGILAICLFLFPLLLYSQTSVNDLEFFIEDELNTEILEVKMESDWKQLRKKKSDPKYQPAKMTFFFSENDSVELKLKIKPRGEFRRNHCHFPPVWLNFKKKDFRNSSVKNYDKIKLVTHCRDQTSYKQQLLIEYYIYKMYEMFADYSFRTRLLKINYKDTVNRREPGWNYAFLIETEEQVADRTNTVNFESSAMHPERLNREITTVMDVFQFMIGNTDWSVVAQHNIKLLKSKDPTDYMPIPVPYDFDYCGLVDAHYAIPHESLGIEKITDRLYRGFCRTDEEFDRVFKMFKVKEEEILGLIENSELLEKRYKYQATEYLEESLRILSNDRMSQTYIKSMCREVD